MNVECDFAQLEEVTTAFRFNDAVIRHLVVSCNKAETEPSPQVRRGEDDKLDRRENN